MLQPKKIIDYPKIEVERLTKSFGNNLVFKDVNFTLAQSKVLTVIGPSGSGKTTLLRCLNLLETINSGSITWNGKPVIENCNGKNPRLFITPTNYRQKIGMVFQEYNLWPNKTVLENIIEAPCYVKKMPRNNAIKHTKYLCEKFGIISKLYDYPISLSGGQKQRVAFARALAMEPELLLLDEVTAALDPELVGEILDIIAQLKFDGYTMIIVTHHLGFARFVSDEIIFLADQHIVEHGSPEKVLESPSDPKTREFVNSLLRVEPKKFLRSKRSLNDNR